MEDVIEHILRNIVVKKFKGMKNLIASYDPSNQVSIHENINMSGLNPFVTAVLNEETVNERFLAEIIASYDPRNQAARIKGRVLNVNKDALASALHLPPAPAALGNNNDTRFLYLFVTRFMLLNPRNTNEVVDKILEMKDHPEPFDFAGFIWSLVKDEMLDIKRDLNKKCYYGQHLHCLIRSQHPDLFANLAMEPKIMHILSNLVIQEFKGMKRLESVSQATQENINRYGLSSFVTAVMKEEDLNKRFLAELFATYDLKKQVAKISGREVNVNKDALAAALHLPLDHMAALDLVSSSDYTNFLHPFVVSFMFLYVGSMEVVHKQREEVVQRMYDIKEHPQLFDFAAFMWWFVENEILQGLNIKKCYCGRHLQCLIRSQHSDLFDDYDGEFDGTKIYDDDDDDADDDDDVLIFQESRDTDDDDDDTDDGDTDDTDDGGFYDYDGEFDDDEEEDEKTKQPYGSQASRDQPASSKKGLVDSQTKKQPSKRNQDEESKA